MSQYSEEKNQSKNMDSFCKDLRFFLKEYKTFQNIKDV